MAEECKIIQKLPKAFRIFLSLEEAAKKKGTPPSNDNNEASGGDP
jgi:hypothetical protein